MRDEVNQENRSVNAVHCQQRSFLEEKWNFRGFEVARELNSPL